MKLIGKCFLGAMVFYTLLSQSAYSQNSTVTKAFLIGKTNYSRDTSFVKVSSKYAGKTIYIKKQAYDAYLKMYAAAAKEGVTLNMLSGARSFYDQHRIWENKWANQFTPGSGVVNIALSLLRWSSMPGTSRHHWGTDIDLVSMKLAYYKTPAGKKMYDWMKKNASRFGFYQPFDAGRTAGYQEEKWHWSYLPLSKVYLNEYIRQITYADISGFKGSEAASKLDVINSQVLAINIACK